MSRSALARGHNAMTPRQHRDMKYIIYVAIAVVVALLIYIGINGWNGISPD
jgi:hypothetical protein